MKNKDTLNQTQLEIAQRISNAARDGDTEAFENGLQDLFTNIQDEIVASATSLRDVVDVAILAQRGVRQLTSEETEFYNTVIEAMKLAAGNGGNAMMALTNVDKTFPETIVSQVMEDMVQAHPLLGAIDTVNTTGLTRFIMNTDEGGVGATWGKITDAITQEIASGFKEVDLSQNKLSAFMPISLGLLDLGPAWLDTYIRRCLSEALALGYEFGIVSGTGKDMPIGMDRSVADDVTVVAGVYPQKDLITVLEFTPSTYGGLIKRLAKTQHNKPRAVNGLILVVNPFDYYDVVMPATTIMTPDGKYVNDVLPVPTQIIQSVAIPQKQAILGIGKKYWLGVAGNRGIQFSDEYKFLDDDRYYKIVAYGNGRPKDDNAFLRLNIANLQPTYLRTISTNAPTATKYTFAFDMQSHGSSIESQQVVAGEAATKPTDPTAEGYTFGGWYKEAACTNAFDFATLIYEATTVYAKWTAVEAQAGGGGT